MIPSLISLAFILHTSYGAYCEICPLMKGNIERVKSQYSIFHNNRLMVETDYKYPYMLKCFVVQYVHTKNIKYSNIHHLDESVCSKSSIIGKFS